MSTTLMPGKALDQLIAKKLGWTEGPVDGDYISAEGIDLHLSSGNFWSKNPRFSPSTNLQHAWVLMERLNIAVMKTFPGPWCAVHGEHIEYVDEWRECETPELAICTEALYQLAPEMFGL